MSNHDWYQTKSWYAPLKRVEPEGNLQETAAIPAEAQTKPRKSFRTALTVLIALTLVTALLAGIILPVHIQRMRNGGASVSGLVPGSAQAFSDGRQKDSGQDSRFGNDAGLPGRSRSSEGTGLDPLPKGDGDEDEDGDDEMPESPEDFFENFYEETDTSNAVVNIPRTELPDDFSLTLTPSDKRELSLQELYERCSSSIVAISGYTDGMSGYNWGTGVVLSSDGLILTNTHVIDACDRATVTLADDSEYEAKLIGADTFSDLAVLKIEAEGLSPAEFGDSNALLVGDPVAAIGNPLGKSFRCTLTDGIISAISRDISYKGRSMTLLQTNAALNEGNSGGALFNRQGQVIGITNMKMMSSYSSIEGIGFAIPSSTVEEVVNSLVNVGEVRGRPSIGITVGAIPEEAMKFYSLPEGLYITDVQKNSDAWAKGIRPGDVLTAVNSIPVTTTSEVSAIKDAYGVGDSLHMTIWRNGEYLELDVELMDTNDLYGG
ncbi:MAG: trypsin-like peptidase domain-containing protein [Oscillospiraceae bacterium]|nr:trypsin-like peptidase domain-containing protein [Oscillospiraceae bacterium]